MKNEKKDGVPVGKIIAVGTGVAAGASAYYLFGPNGKKHQKNVAKLINNAEKKVLKETKSIIEKGKNFVDEATHVVKDVIKNNS